MNDLVFIKSGRINAEPFTTSAVISMNAGIAHKKLKSAIRKYEKEIKSFGLLASYRSESNGGRPEEYYLLNEPQSAFILTLLKNTPQVVAFKKELVSQFYAMRAELLRRQTLRETLKPIHRELTDVVKESDPSEWAYKRYTDLAYKTATGMNAAQLRRDRGAQRKAKAIEYLTSYELEAVTKIENEISILLELHLDYKQIKALILNRRQLSKPA